MSADYRVADFPLILLAGGASSRMGTPKGLLPVKGRPFLSWQLRRFRAAGGTRAIVVTGADALAYRETIGFVSAALSSEVKRNDVCQGLAIRVVENTSWELGPLSSLLKGIEVYSEDLYSDALGAFVSPIDTPAPDPEVWRRLAARFSMQLGAIKPTYRSRGGHPVLLTDLFLQKLRDVDMDGEDARLDLQMRHLDSKQIARVSVDDPQVICNLNTPPLWQAWLDELG